MGSMLRQHLNKAIDSVLPHLPRKWYARLTLWRSLDAHLNRRATVENYLFQAAAGQKALPDAEKCKELALRLGVVDR